MRGGAAVGKMGKMRGRGCCWEGEGGGGAAGGKMGW